MRLNTKFSIISGFVIASVSLLGLLIAINVNRVNALRSYLYLERTIQFNLSDVTNYLNETVSWGIDPKVMHKDWQAKLVNLNKQFRQLKDDKAIKHFPDDFQDLTTKSASVWQMVINVVNPINAQYKAMQACNLNDEELNLIRRMGIVKARSRLPDSPALQEMIDNQLIIHTCMEGMIKQEKELANILASMNDIISSELDKASHNAYVLIVGLGIALCIAMYLFIFKSTNSVTKSILKLRDFSTELSQKNFTEVLNPEGTSEIRNLMANINEMVEEVNSFFIMVKSASSKAISSGANINEAAAETSAASSEINSSIELITGEFDKINLSVSNAANAVKEINDQVKTLVEDNNNQTKAIDDCTTAITNMAKEINIIKDNAEERKKNAEEMRTLLMDGDSKINATNHILEEVMGQLDEIGQVIDIINNVSEQTNLLSMNAAIESAHAGEYGKGFAVVAEEIRSLAESTADNAKKITESISNIIEKVTEASSSSVNAAQAFSMVNSHSTAVIDSFTEIANGIDKLASETVEVTKRTDVTAETADKINKYCSNLASKQETISMEINSINTLFGGTVDNIHTIKDGTEDIVRRMTSIDDLSTESYNNMSELEEVLKQFKTSGEMMEEEETEKVDDRVFNNKISSSLQEQLMEDFKANTDLMDSALPKDDLE